MFRLKINTNKKKNDAVIDKTASIADARNKIDHIDL